MISLRGARTWHRRIAIGAGLIVAWFAASGIVLNHAADLGLHERPLSPALARFFYAGKLPPVIAAYRAGSAMVVTVNGTLWHVAGEARAIAPCAALVGAADTGSMHIAACRDAVYVLDARGARIERIDATWGLAGDVAAIGIAPRGLVITTTHGNWCIDNAITSANRCDLVAQEALPAPLADAPRTLLSSAMAVPDVDTEQFVHDLHSGRLFGKAARYAWDLFAVALLLLAISGTRVLLRRENPLRRDT